jgi:hypothetical protein
MEIKMTTYSYHERQEERHALAIYYSFLYISGFGIVIAGIWFSVTGSVLPGITVAAIGIVVVAIALNADIVFSGIKSAERTRSSEIKFSNDLDSIQHQITNIVAQLDEKTKYIAAAILAARIYETGTPQHGDEPEAPDPAASESAAPPPYVTAASEEMAVELRRQRTEIAVEVLRQRLVGRTHEQALLFTAEKFGQPERVISEAWDTDRNEAFRLVFEEVRREGWEFTEEARTHLREIFFPSGQIDWRKFRKRAETRGTLGEVIADIRKEFIENKFQSRAEEGVVLNSLEDEAKAILDEIKSHFESMRKIAEKQYPEQYLPEATTIENIITSKHIEYISARYDAKRSVARNSRRISEFYKRVSGDLGLSFDLFTNNFIAH